jgi:putative addiction module antidote
MATILHLTKIGNSVGAVIPRDVLQRLNLEVGDDLYLTESPDGMRLTPYSPEFAEQMAVFDGIAKRRRSVLRELAK